MFFMKSAIELNDNVWDIYDTEKRTEYLFETSRRYDYFNRMSDGMDRAEREYLGIFFRADNERRLYKREGYDILTYLGDLGGLLDFVLLLGWLVTTVFAGKLFEAALIGASYRI